MKTLFPATVFPLIGGLAEKLMAGRLLLGTAESCTGGLLAGACTELPGSSRWFAGGFTVYTNELKERMLGVPAGLLETYGAVSEPVVRLMAENALNRLGVDLAVAVSGVAGPDGGSAVKPVGTVWLAGSIAGKNGPATLTEGHRFFGERADIRLQTVYAGLALAERLLDLEKS